VDTIRYQAPDLLGASDAQEPWHQTHFRKRRTNTPSIKFSRLRQLRRCTHATGPIEEKSIQISQNHKYTSDYFLNSRIPQYHHLGPHNQLSGECLRVWNTDNYSLAFALAGRCRVTAAAASTIESRSFVLVTKVTLSPSFHIDVTRVSPG